MLCPEKEFALSLTLKDARQLRKSFLIGNYFNYEIKLCFRQVSKNQNPTLQMAVLFKTTHRTDDPTENVELPVNFETWFVASSGEIVKHQSVRWNFRTNYRYIVQDLRWQDLEKALIGEDLKLEHRMKIIEKNRCFDDESNELTNVVLKVGNEKFYVNKGILAFQSPYFKGLFMGNFEDSAKKEPELKEIGSYLFQKFLEALHGEPVINDGNVRGILKIADMYLAQPVKRSCENFLMKVSKMTHKELFELALKYNFEDLKKHCVLYSNSLPELNELLPENLDDMDKATLVSVLEKSRKLESNHVRTRSPELSSKEDRQSDERRVGPSQRRIQNELNRDWNQVLIERRNNDLDDWILARFNRNERNENFDRREDRDQDRNPPGERFDEEPPRFNNIRLPIARNQGNRWYHRNNGPRNYGYRDNGRNQPRDESPDIVENFRPRNGRDGRDRQLGPHNQFQNNGNYRQRNGDEVRDNDRREFQREMGFNGFNRGRGGRGRGRGLGGRGQRGRNF